jgi:hypothetical protein
MIFLDTMSRSDNGKERDIFGITIPLHSASYRSSFKLKNNYDVSVSFIIHPVTKTFKLAGKIKDEDATVRNERNETATPLGDWSRYRMI